MKPLLTTLVLFHLALGGPSQPLASENGDDAKTISNTIRWATSSEVRNFGYDVFRSANEDGPFERVTELPIPGHGTTDIPQNYKFTDSSIAPDTTYFYYVESISMDGERERFTPIYSAKPKSLP